MPSWRRGSRRLGAAWAYSNAARVELKRQGTEIVGVHVGYVDTDLTANLDGEKIEASVVAASAPDAPQAGLSEAVVDEMSRAVKAALHDDQRLLHPEVAARFAELSPA